MPPPAGDADQLLCACLSTPTPLPRSADNERAQRQVRELQSRVRASEAQLGPLQSRIRSLEAGAEGAAAELASARDQAERWQKRAQQLMQKYDSVDQQEHQRVLAELREAQQRAAAAEAQAAASAEAAGAAQQALAGEQAALGGLRRRVEELGKEGDARAEEVAKAKVGGALVPCTPGVTHGVPVVRAMRAGPCLLGAAFQRRHPLGAPRLTLCATHCFLFLDTPASTARINAIHGMAARSLLTHRSSPDVVPPSRARRRRSWRRRARRTAA